MLCKYIKEMNFYKSIGLLKTHRGCNGTISPTKQIISKGEGNLVVKTIIVKVFKNKKSC